MGRWLGRGGDGEGGGETSEGDDRQIRRNRGKSDRSARLRIDRRRNRHDDEPTETREQIASKIGARMKLAMDSGGCRTYQGGMRVQADDNSKAFNKFKPEERCGPPGTPAYITDPVVVEVLSPSAMDNDRGPKLRLYKALPTVQHIVLVYYDKCAANIVGEWKTVGDSKL
jgi:hypothetical protein